MPLMQACFTRCGQPIPMRVDKYDYLFTENQDGVFVANVTAEDHIKYLLETGNFKMYESPTKTAGAGKNQKPEGGSEKK